MYLLGIQRLISLCDGLAGYAIPFYNAIAAQNARMPPEPVRSPGPLDPSTLPKSGAAHLGLQTVRAMFIAGWPALLTTLSFLCKPFIINLSDPSFSEILIALQALARAAGRLVPPCRATRSSPLS